MSETSNEFLVEQLTLEVLGVYSHLERLKETFGVVTQWEGGAWLILQFLEEQGRCRMNTLLAEQHISQEYAQGLLNDLLKSELVKSDEHHPEIHAHYEITKHGVNALERLRKAMHGGFGQFDDDFEAPKLKTAIDTLKLYRHRLECIKI